MTDGRDVYRQRLMASVARGEGPDACWMWQGPKHRQGYGFVCTKGWTDRKQMTTHRAAYLLFVGEVPAGHEIMHTCCNNACVRPSHLFTGPSGTRNTYASFRGTNAHGSRNHNSKLTEQQVREIRLDPRPAAVVAAEYGISKSTVWKLRAKGTWKHLDRGDSANGAAPENATPPDQ